MIARHDPRVSIPMRWQEPEPLFNVPRVFDKAIAHDGRSLYFLAPNPDSPAREINIVVNWLQDSLTATSATSPR